MGASASTNTCAANLLNSTIMECPTGTNPSAHHDVMHFRQMLANLRAKARPLLPTKDAVETELLRSACASVAAAQKARDAAKKAVDKASSDEEKKAASQALGAAEEALSDAINTAVEVAEPILQKLEEPLLQNKSLDKLLLPCSIIVTASPKGLADFCSRGKSEEKMVDDLLKDVGLMRYMIEAGGAKNGRYGEAMQNYLAMNVSPDQGILSRLALGTALELAVPQNEFDSKIVVDPVERYRHFEEAYLAGELDPSFIQRSAWECRYISNSDAPNSQLSWFRGMLRNYRPDHMELDYTWRYVRIVRTEVHYCQPHWTSSPHTYPQIISGGGKCGPRAWFGRFSLRAFGIPTWGVRQPGHAALGHWTPDKGWVICLGSAWKWSWWEDRQGLDFLLESQARESKDDYMGVCRLECVADTVGERKTNGRINPDYLWRSLALLQTHRLAAAASTASALKKASSKNQTIMAATCLDKKMDFTLYKHDGTIVVPAVSCSMPKKSTPKAIFMKSFLGGMQLHLREDQALEYTLKDVPERHNYHLSILLVNVHAEQQPLLLSVNQSGNDSPVAITTIVIPYTVGEWAVTYPVEIELGKGENILTFTRETPNSGLTIKELTLKPAQ